jgi:ribosomal protein L11 methyltransferase
MDYHKISINIQPRTPWVDVFIAHLGELGCESFEETNEGLNAFVSVSNYKEEINEYLEEGNLNESFKLNFSIELVPAKNWNKVWESSFEPILVENWCSIIAPFHQNVPQTEFQIIIEPKMSFGTGHHQTTYMMVNAMREMDLNGKTVLDMGSGTGILAILAKKMKASFVEAIDIEEWAVENCIENSKRNNVSFDVKLGGKEMISSLKFDVILANINLNILLDQLNVYAENIKQAGVLLLSGFLSVDEEVFTKAAEDAGFVFNKKYSKDNWLCLAFSKK